VGSKIIVSLLCVALAAGLIFGAVGVYRLRTVSPAAFIPTMLEAPAFDQAELSERDYATIGDYVYFASFGRYMYRANLQNFSRELYLQMPVWGIITDGERLFFATAIGEAPALMSYDPAGGDMLAITNEIDARAGIRYYGGMVFFVDGRGRVRCVLPCGRPVATFSPTDVAAFDVRFPILEFTQHGSNLQKEYNMNTGEINFQ